MSNTNTFKLTPVGRIVQGCMWTMSTEGYQGKEQKPTIYVGLAIPKTDPEVNAVMNDIHNCAINGFPQFFNNGQCTKSDFSFKYYDGDSPEHVNKEGFQGCWVLKLSTGFAVQVYKKNLQSGRQEPIVDSSQCKKGDYARVQYSVVSNGDPTKSGVYLNLGRMAEHIGYGEAIMSGPDANELFTNQAQMPQGASQTPVGSGSFPSQGNQQGFQPQQQPQQGQQQAPQQNFQPQQQAPQQNFQPQQRAPQQGYQQAPDQNAPQQGYQQAPEQNAPQQGFQNAPQQGFQNAPQQGYQQAPEQNAPQQGYQNAPQQGYQQAPEQNAPQQGFQPQQNAPQQQQQNAPQQQQQNAPQQGYQPPPNHTYMNQ
jgi:hypothetical protein